MGSGVLGRRGNGAGYTLFRSRRPVLGASTAAPIFTPCVRRWLPRGFTVVGLVAALGVQLALNPPKEFCVLRCPHLGTHLYGGNNGFRKNPGTKTLSWILQPEFSLLYCLGVRERCRFAGWDSVVLTA